MQIGLWNLRFAAQHFQCTNTQRTMPQYVHIPANVALESCQTNGAIPFESSCDLALARPCDVILYGVGNLLVTFAV
jgi:hypothetical protein